MDLSTIHHGANRRTRKKRVGRGPGSGMGKTSTRGHKGQWASAGAGKPGPLYEGGQMPLYRRVPKRGFSHATWDKHFHVVNVRDLNDKFADGDRVDPESLEKVGLTRGKAAGVRILGDGDLSRRLTVRAHHFSKSAAEKIAAKAGQTEIIPPRKKPKRNKMKARPSKEA